MSKMPNPFRNRMSTKGMDVESVSTQSEESQELDELSEAGPDPHLGISGWVHTQKVIKSRIMGKAFKSKQRQKLEDEKIVEHKSEFRLFSDHLAGSFEDHEEDPDWGKANKDDSSLNVLRVQKYLNNTRMKELARDNMPFMALEIHGLAEAKLRTNLPHTANMIQRGIRIKTLEDLIHMPRLDAVEPTPGITKSHPPPPKASASRAGSLEMPGVQPPPPQAPKKSDKPGMPGVTKRLPPGPGPRGSMETGTLGMGLPIITEKSGPPSVITEGDSSAADE